MMVEKLRLGVNTDHVATIRNARGGAHPDPPRAARVAADAGADYVAFGAFFATDTKQASATVDVEMLEWWSGLFEVPCVAIGGITVDNCRPLVEAGADFLSVVAGVWSYDNGPAAAVRDFNNVMVDAP